MIHEHDILRESTLGICVPCVVLLALQWSSGPTRMHVKLVTEGRMMKNFCRVADVALESAIKFQTPQLFVPRTFLLAAQGLVFAMHQGIGWWQIRPNIQMRGWEIGGQRELT